MIHATTLEKKTSLGQTSGTSYSVTALVKDFLLNLLEIQASNLNNSKSVPFQCPPAT